MKVNTAIAAIALLTGAISSVINREWFTSYTLIETILLVAPLLYFIFKYWASAIIARYQQPAYSASGTARFWHDMIVTASFKVIQPLCLDFIYACLILFTVKMADPSRLTMLATVVQKIWLFNAAYIKSPLKILVIILSCLTLLSFLPDKSFKKIKKGIAYFKLPLKFVAILVLFLNIDKGAASKVLEWNLNRETPKFRDGDQVTFNAAEEKNLSEMIRSYTELMVAELAREQTAEDDRKPDPVPPGIFYKALDLAFRYNDQDPSVKLDLFAGKGIKVDPSRRTPDAIFTKHLSSGGAPDFSKQEQDMIDDLYQKSYVTSMEPRISSGELAEAGKSVAGSGSKFRTFLNIITDERKAITSTELSASEEILREIIGNYLGETALYGRLKKSVGFYAFADDKVFDAAKEQIVAGFFYVVKKAKNGIMQRSDLRFTAEVFRNTFRSRLRPMLAKIVTAKQVFGDFTHYYKKALDFKMIFNADPASFTTARIKQYIDLYPNDSQAEKLKKLLPALMSKTDEKAILELDIPYWEKVAGGMDDPKEKATLRSAIKEWQKKIDIQIATGSKNPEDWQRLADLYPDLAKDKTVQHNIRVLTENKDLRTAVGIGDVESWKEFVRKHPYSPHASTIRTRLALGEAYKIAPEGSIILKSTTIHALEGPILRKTPSFWSKVWRVASHIR